MQHLACIMDGNRRFAKRHGWKPWIGHSKGVDAVRETIEFCIRNAISYLTLYAFSLENFKRSDEEKHYLFELMVEQMSAHVAIFNEQRTQVRFIGDRAVFPAHVLAACEKLEQKTADGKALQVNVLFCYGGQQEIVAAAKSIAQQVQQGQIAVNDIDVSCVKRNLWLGDIPAPDLIFRTGGVHRLSNFLLFEAAYAELYFSDLMWPEVTGDYLQQVLNSFNERTRNFGS